MTATIDTTEVSRRAVLAGLGGLSFCLAFGAGGLRLVPDAGASAGAGQITQWVRIAPDGAVTILSAGAEMGQGSMTSLAAIVAEEMDADWSRVAIEFAPADPKLYGYAVGSNRMMAIVGSRAVMLYYNDLRIAGAQVRRVLLMNAAERLGVELSSLTTEPGVVIHGASGRRLTYGEIAATGKVPDPLPAIAAGDLKDPARFRLIGRSVGRHDIPPKVNGTARYAIDVHLPGMVYATTLHSPVHNSEPESWNDAGIRAMPGVVGTVRLANGVAVIADRFERANAARAALQVKWRPGRAQGFDSETALDQDYAALHRDASARKETLDSKGDAAAAFAGAARRFRAEFRSDLGYHAQMEPLNAVARFNDAGDRVEIWEGSQAPDGSRAAVARALGFSTDQVEFHQCYMGGGYGRRSLGDYASEAALIARAVRRPVKLIWTREEDMAQGMFRPQSFQCLEAALDASGTVTGWRHCVVGDGGNLLTTGIRIPYYGVPNQNIERLGVSHGIKLKHWRAVGHVFNVYAIESFVDQLAVEAGMDPIAFRIERMAMTPRARACFEAVARMCDWTAKRPDGRALGISITERSGSLGAGVTEISLDRESGRIRVHKAWVAVDGGTIVQPDAATANIESGIVHGISSVLFERATVSDGVVDQSNFHDYTLMRMSDVPDEMHVSFVGTGGRPTGLGEIGNPFIAAAIANAFHRLTGKRLYHMPFTPERVLEVLRA